VEGKGGFCSSYACFYCHEDSSHGHAQMWAAQDYVAWKHTSNGDLLSPITPQYNICNGGS